MKTRETDVAILGAGTAGLSARREAARAGARTLLVEAGPHGTTCARVGCMPSKLLIAAADAAHAVARAPVFGVEVPGGARVDGPRVLARVRRERDRFVGSVLDAVEAIPQDERIAGHARFAGPTTLEVDDHTRIEAGAVVVATGAAPWVPPELVPLGDALLGSDDVFELEDLPRSLAVFGTGPVGLELGQALARLGVETSFFGPSTALGPFTDPELERAARELLGAELDLHTGVAYEVAREPRGEVRVTWTGGEREGVGRFGAALAATGRRPLLAGLGLAEAGLPVDERGAPRFDPTTMQCGDAPVFVAGDATGERPLLHEASDEGTIAGRNAARPGDVRAHARRTPLSIVFTDPQMAVVGRAFEALDPEGCEIGSVSYENQGRARVMARGGGLVRVYGDRESHRLLGAELLGPDVEHLAHELAWAVQCGLTAREAYGLPFYHPVLEEGLRTAVRDLCRRLGTVGESGPRDLEHGPGC